MSFFFQSHFCAFVNPYFYSGYGKIGKLHATKKAVLGFEYKTEQGCLKNYARTYNWG
jgi:hypothetical protein